jgi:diguanylate cyclase (GGDEF) domain
MTRIQLNIDTIIKTTSNLSSTYFTNKDLSWALETYSNSSKESLITIREIDSQILANQMVHRFIKQINIYFDNNDLFETNYAHHLDDKTLQTDWYRNFIASQQNTYINAEGHGLKANLYFVRKLNMKRYESKNIIKIDISSDALQSCFISELLNKDNCSIYILNAQNQVKLSNISNMPNTLQTIEKEKPQYIYSKPFDRDSLLKNWKIVIIPNKSILYSNLNKEVSFLIITFLLILLFSMILFYGLAHSIISRLEYIASVMDQSKNDELTEIKIAMGNDEIGITAKRYNSMIQRIRSLINENIRANEELQSTNVELVASIDVIENKERQIDELIYLDKLTGLANRFAITRFIDNQFIEMNGLEKFSIGFLDIDNFKLINDTYGHDIGDEIIKHTGLRLKCFENENIHIGRFGGDEFIITVKNFKDLEQLKAIHNDIRVALKEVIVVHNITFLLTISIGVSLYGVHSKSRHELIKLADIALYKAKELGRDKIVLFETSMNQALSEKLACQASIRELMQDNAFILHYQPYYDINTQTMKGCEALLRWKNNYKLNMTPQDVVHSIEEMGLMIEFGFWIIKEACSFAKRINENRSIPLIVSINISSLQLMQKDFAKKVLKIISDNQVNKNYISLEMTESILMDSIEKGSSVINEFRKAGISISLDDFGTGYSSLKYFKELPISVLKIDKSFIDHISTNIYDEQLVDTMIQLAHNKKIQVIAEGVETTIQLDRLKNINCDMVQGYLYSKPVNENELIRLAQQTENI